MTTEQKIERLTEARKRIKSLGGTRPDNRRIYGLCWALNAYSDRAMEQYGIAERPCDDNGFWFSLDSEGDKKRIAIIDSAIARLSKKLNPVGA